MIVRSVRVFQWPMKLMRLHLQLTPRFNPPTEPYDIISVSLFRMRNAYKADDIYIDGMRRIVDNVKEFLPGVYVRIHFDDSICTGDAKWRELFADLSDDNTVQLMHYKHPRFASSDGTHEGLFGTLIRFHPLFDYPANKNLRTVYVTDIDNLITNRNVMLLNEFRASASHFHFRTRACYGAIRRLELAEREMPADRMPKLWHRIVASLMISKIKFPKALFEDFLACLDNPESDACSYIENFGKHRAQVSHTRRWLTYGIDEFFLNTVFMKHIDDKRIPFSYSIQNDVCRVISDLRPKDPKQRTIANKLMNRILGERHANPRHKLMLKLSDDFSPSYDVVAGRLIHEFEHMRDTKTFAESGLTERQVECVLRQGLARGSDFILCTRESRSLPAMFDAAFPQMKTTVLTADQREKVDDMLTWRIARGISVRDLIDTLCKRGEDRVYLRGGSVRALFSGETQVNDLDLTIHPASVQAGAQRIRRRYGDTLKVRASRKVPLVQIVGEEDQEIDLFEPRMNANQYDATMNMLYLDLSTHTVMDLTGHGIEHAQQKAYRIPCSPAHYVSTQSIMLMWRLIKFLDRGFDIDDAESAFLLKHYYALDEPIEGDAGWQTLPFRSQIPPDRVLHAFAAIKKHIDRLHASNMTPFDGGDMLLRFIERGSLVVRSPPESVGQGQTLPRPDEAGVTRRPPKRRSKSDHLRTPRHKPRRP